MSCPLRHREGDLQDSSPPRVPVGVSLTSGPAQPCQQKYFHGQCSQLDLLLHGMQPVPSAFRPMPNVSEHTSHRVPSAVLQHQHCGRACRPPLEPVQYYGWFGLKAYPAKPSHYLDEYLPAALTSPCHLLADQQVQECNLSRHLYNATRLYVPND